MRNQIDERSTRRNDTPGAPHLGARPWEVDQWPTLTGKMPGGRLAGPPGQEPPAGSPVRLVLRHYLTFCQVWRVKQPSNSTKLRPLLPYRRDLRNDKITLHDALAISRKRLNTYAKSERRTINEAKRHPGSPLPGGSVMGGRPMADPHW